MCHEHLADTDTRLVFMSSYVMLNSKCDALDSFCNVFSASMSAN